MSLLPEARIPMDVECMALAGGVPRPMYWGAEPLCLLEPWALS